MRLRLDAIKYTILFLWIEMQSLDFESKKIRIENARIKFGKFLRNYVLYIFSIPLAPL